MKTLIVIAALAIAGCGIKQESGQAGLPVIDKCEQQKYFDRCVGTVTDDQLRRYHYSKKKDINSYCEKRAYEMAYMKSITNTPKNSCRGVGS